MTDKKYTADLLVPKPSAFEVTKATEKSKRYKSEGTGSNSSRIYSCKREREKKTCARMHTHKYIYFFSIEK